MMNRFRARKKAPKDAALASPVEAPEDVRPPMAVSSKSFRRGKKKTPPPKPELDVAHALPSSDDFRTSLLMPNLSARFSMLREQDDPLSKLGKASDDSVLFPKRASRFGVGLDDIAEVASIHGSVRPPFAAIRADSYTSGDGYGTDDDMSSHNGSMMGRSRPGEGNSLFGGRQKIYKLPTSGASSTKTLGATGGKPIYENDVHMSAFQRMRAEKDRQAAAAAAAARDQEDHVDDEPHGSFNLQTRNRVPSPPLIGYNRNRETSSSTNSGPSNGRTSTAATSVTSQGPAPDLERSMTKSRRLYDQGLDQHLYDQQSSAMHRLDQLTRLRQVGANSPVHNGPSLSHARSAGNLNERYDRNGLPRSATSNLPVTSPPVSAPPPIPSTMRPANGEPRSNASSPHPRNRPMSPPVSPLQDEEDEPSVLPAAIRPEDRGKATAMGAFNKPVRPYDDRQYSQRQLQLQHGRETPPPTRGISPASVENVAVSANRSTAKRSSPPYANGAPLSGPTRSMNMPAEGLSRRTTDSRAEESSTAPSGSDMSATEESDLEGRRSDDTDSHVQTRQDIPFAPTARLRIASESPPRESRDQQESEPRDSTSSGTDEDQRIPAIKTIGNEGDSPTLGPAAPGLSGMIRQHLRTDSDKSSVYNPASPIAARVPAGGPPPQAEKQSSPPRDTLNRSPPNQHDPRAYRQWKRNKIAGNGMQSSFVNRPFANFDSATDANRMDDEREDESDDQDPDVNGSFGVEVNNASHNREASTETQREREAFASELAQRRKMVQENLKSSAEAESRTSPGAGNRGDSSAPRKSPVKTNAFGMLKPRSPNPAAVVAAIPEAPSKALKKLGLSNGNSRGHTPPSEHWREEEDRMRRAYGKNNKMPQPQARQKTLQQSERDALREQEQRSQTNGAHPGFRNGSNPSSRATSQASMRDRAGSDASVGPGGRSMSRNARHREDMVDGRSTPVGYPQTPAQDASTRPRHLPNSPRLDAEAQPSPDSSTRPRQFSNSPRMGAEGYQPTAFEHPAHAAYATSPRVGPDAFQPTAFEHPAHVGSGRSRSNSKATSPALYDNRPTMSPPPSSVVAHRQSPATVPRNASPSSQPEERSWSPSTTSAPSSREGVQNPSSSASSTMRKKSINKSDISEPTFLSCTSNITTVSLPPGSSLSNGADATAEQPPPVPPINPRRRRMGNPQTVVGTIGRGGADSISPHLPSSVFAPSPELGTHSADEDGPGAKPSWRGHRLKKSLSEGGELNVKARQQGLDAPAPAPVEGSGVYHAGYEGVMF